MSKNITLESIADKLDVEVDDLFALDKDGMKSLSKKEKQYLQEKIAEVSSGFPHANEILRVV